MSLTAAAAQTRQIFLRPGAEPKQMRRIQCNVTMLTSAVSAGPQCILHCDEIAQKISEAKVHRTEVPVATPSRRECRYYARMVTRGLAAV
jgi:hypothetical protein